MAKVTKTKVSFSDTDERKTFGDHLKEIVDACNSGKGGLPDRWAKNQAYYDNQPEPTTLPYVDAPLTHHPLTQPKIDLLNAVVVTTVFSQDTIFLGSYAGNPDAAAKVQQQVAFFVDDELEPKIDETAVSTAIRNHGFLRVEFEASAQGFLPLANVKSIPTGPFSSAGIRYDYIPPEDMDIFPDTARSIQSAQYVGHRFWMQVRDVEALQKAGRYDDGVEIKVTGHPSETGQSAKDFNFGRTSQATTGKREEALVQIATGVLRHDFGKGEARYQVTFLCETGDILRIKPFRGSRPNYVDFNYKVKQPDSYWSATSIGQDLQGLQWSYNIQHNVAAYGTIMKSFQPILGEGPANKVQKVVPASVVMVPGKVVGGLNSTYDPSMSMFVISQLERQADAVTGVTQEATGASISKRQTKAEYEGRQMGAGKKLAKFLQTFNLGLVEVAEIVQELLWLNYEVWTMAFPGCVFCSQADLMLPIRWRVQGSTPDTTPEALREKLAFIRQIAAEEMAMAQGQVDPMTGQRTPTVIDPMTGGPIMPAINLQKLDRAIVRAEQISGSEEFMNPEVQVGNGNPAAMGGMGIPSANPNPLLAPANGAGIPNELAV